MRVNLLQFFTSFLLLIGLFLLPDQGWSQCNNVSPFGTATAPTTAAPVTITSCAFGGEYSTINSCVAGNGYTFTGTGGTGNFLTIRQGTSSGTVLGFGFSPITVTCTVSGPLFLHYNTNAACGTDASCHVGTVACTSCAPPAGSVNCLTTSQFPSGLQSLAVANTGAVQTISTCNFAGEFYAVTGVIAGASYTCTSSAAGDYLTVRSGTSAGAVVAQGAAPLTFTAASGADLFVHISLATACGTQNSCRTTTIVKNSCSNTAQFPSTAVSLTPTNGSGNVQTISTCNFAGEYIQLTNVVSGNPYQITSSVATDFITVRVGSANGAILNSGVTPLTVTAASASDLFVHINTNSACGTQNICRITTVRCTSCSPAPACVTPTSPANGLSGICPGVTQTLTWPVSSSATSYDLYFGTAATPPFLLNQAGTTYTTAALTAGTYYWQVRPNNSIGTASGCVIWSFTVGDIAPPVITCPAGATVSNTTNQCSAVVTFASATATDNCGAPTVTLFSGLASGSTFPVGVTTNVWRALDPNGNTSTCAQVITVNDTQLPTITCPANIASANDPNVCGAVKTFVTPTGADNCPGVMVSLLSGLPSGSTFPVGTTVNVFRARDAANNAVTCSFTVIITDTQLPSIVCPSNKLKNNDPGDCGKTMSASELGTATVLDNCGISASSNNSPGFFPIGTSTVVWSTSDFSGNVKTCVQTVSVLDYEFPTISCPANINVAGQPAVCSSVVDFQAVTTDNCPGVTVSYNIAPQTEFLIGLTSVKATATDASGHSVSCNFIVTVAAAAEICNNEDDDCDGYVDEAQNWSRTVKHGAKTLAANENYGQAVDIDDDWAIVGSRRVPSNGVDSGAAYILSRNVFGDNKWGSVALLQPAGLLTGDDFGHSVAISKLGIAAVGAPGDGIDGAVYMYELDAAGIWMMVKKIVASDVDNSEAFGASVALDRERLVVGDPAQIDQKGGVYVFERNLGGASNWGEAAKLGDPSANVGDRFGSSVAVDSNWVAVGAPGDDLKGDHAGAAHSFKKIGTSYVHTEYVAGVGAANDDLGFSIAVAQGNVFAGAPNSDVNGTDAGAVFLFRANGSQIKIVDFNLKPGAHYGYDVDADKDYLVVTAPLDSAISGAFTSARAFVYTGNDQGWVNMDVFSFPTAIRQIRTHSVAAISGRTVILGAPYDDLATSTAQNGHGTISTFNGLCYENKPAAEFVSAARNNDAGSTQVEVKCTPVPFSEILNIDIQTEAVEAVNIYIFNGMGAEVARFDAPAVNGSSRFVWNAINEVSGIYYVKVQSGSQVQTKVVTLMK